MDKQQIGVLGATSLVGECILRKLLKEQRPIIAFSRHPVTQTHSQIIWQQLISHQTVKINAVKHNIPLWICAAPIWILHDHFDLLLAYGIQRIVVLSSTSRFTKNNSFDPHERKIALKLIKGEELVKTWANSNKIE